MIRVAFFQRKRFPNQFSIEKVFAGLNDYYQAHGLLIAQQQVMPFYSSGLIGRIRNVFWSQARQGEVNHITGDVHYIALALNKQKSILTIHDLNFLNHSNPVARFILKMFWLTLPLKRVAFVTVISEATKADLLSRIRFPEARIKVIPNYYDSSYQAAPKPFNKILPRILQVGTKDNKNVLRLIEALAGIDCHLVIIGGDREPIKRHLQQYNISFTWLKNLTDEELREQYRQCDLLTFVSTIEGFGMPILEAQATGRVVITSNISSMPEVAGEAACFVDPLNVSSIRDGILKVINDDAYRDDLIRKGFLNITRFSIDHVAERYIQLYEETSTGKNT